GDLRSADEQATIALRYASRAKYSAAPPLIYPVLVAVRLAMGDRESTSRTLSEWEATGQRGIRAHRLLADQELTPPADGEARCSPTLNLATLASLGAIVELSGHRGESAQLDLLRRHLDALEDVVFTTTGQLVERLRAILCLLSGDRAAAGAHLRSALQVADRLGNLTELARCHLLLGTVADEVAEADQHAAIGRDLAQRIGLWPGLYAKAGPGPGAPPMGRQRDQLTIAFSDLVGSTALSVEQGDHAYMWAIDRSQELLLGRCAEHGGVGFGIKGDAFVAYFRTAEAAADFALAAQSDVMGLEPSDRPTIELKIGLATGQPILRDGMVYGATVNLAARLSDHALAGAVVADSATRLALRPTHRSESLAALELKGFPDLVPAHRVVARRAAPKPGGGG
ncbi:MAG: adenylate/guanylate cyclase domain-containing protein, partial [Acidimicrobiia bacterium]|nr:adenylate/guanylate cyclase domain-containing protein [Acidimicrobiia bacterium]